MAEQRKREARQAHWPEDVKEITIDRIGLLGVGRSNKLYWDGRQVVTEQRLALTAWQKFWAGVIAIAAIVGGVGGAVQGVNNGRDFACKMHWIAQGCPKP